MQLQLKISGAHHQQLVKHLFSGDGLESVAVALCGRNSQPCGETLLVHEILLIPDQDCLERSVGRLQWPTERIIPFFNRVACTDLAILKIHSHPGGYDQFSKTDDESDREFFNSVFGWTDSDAPHASSVMLPDGNLFGRFIYPDGNYLPIDKISVIGDTIAINELTSIDGLDAFAQRTIQAFGQKTYNLLNSLVIGVVGCSGTGSPTVEQLTRLGVKKLVLIDPDFVEHKNLNRILNTSVRDANEQTPKVKALADAIRLIGLGTETECYPFNLYDHLPSLQSLSGCDVIFGCMDSIDGRHLLNQLCSFYLIPYFDLGVKLEADGIGGIQKICGSVHYLQPGGSSLITRGVYTTADLRASAQFRQNPEEYAALRKNAYIKNVNVNSPSVISVNMQISSHSINEFLNRLHPYKAEGCANYGLSTIDLTENCIVNVSEDSFEIDGYLRKKTGRGDIIPFIEFSDIAT
ncbi:ThiF family adenylyltransferase [Mucilaginibacter sp. OK098]|uniref:ThiF family adenylyltransferase n=1 Tax=Mucilaginibacter sp. OK098 TaxID=1855297 RepID=UPI00091460FA|nr:ThiF family adenylyltransferase [Mucilaginibacter sp. OK098]SHN32842.1 ThiF family protein [Mucilaginibacter sp. OK098]